MAAPPVIARTATYHHTRVGRTELDKLLLVVGDGAPAGTVSVKCTVGSAQLQEDTLDDLIAVRAALPPVSGRTPWDNLTLERDEGPARYVGVEFKDGVVTVTVRSVDPIWTHGQMHRLGEILEELGGRPSRAVIRFKSTIMYLALTVMTGVAVGQAHETHKAHKGNFGVLLTMFILVALITVAVGISEWLERKNLKPVLNPPGLVPWGSPWSRLSTTDRIALVGAGFAGVAAIAAVVALI
ncbi:hypothetical protein [Streptomyces anandii]|uniref:hypothetical protein n=1 Tax=Streptomyces anandii TaxID=285454 RepID=UPI000A4A5435|nr:hypothetical protein [Streptomyces anandii]GGX94638.1 hypothetical protein GCM10010510_44800 [Streptomyces anandii JCM 4720]